MADDEIALEKTTDSFFTCPKCGKKYQMLYGQEECSKCGTTFTEEMTGPEGWKEEEVDAIRCDRCRRLVTCTPDNYSLASDFPAILCSVCKDGPNPNHHIQHTVGIKYNGAWYRPSYFLVESGRNGILSASGLKDRLTIRCLNTEAKMDESRLRSVPESIPVKIYWKDGKAIGYYSYTPPEDEGAAILRQIFVRRDERRKGYATEMLRDFKTSHAGQLAIEAPNEFTLRVLLKMGEVRLQGEEYETTGRIGFLPPQM